MKKDGYTQQQIKMMMNTPQMRLQMGKEQTNNQHNISLVNKYLKEHSDFAKQMTVDYKRDAINNVITELYCKDGQKYIGKNRDLVERARFGETEWCKLKDECNDKM